MQIQRLQSLYLLIAAIFTGVFCVLPFASYTVGDVTEKMAVCDTPVLFIFNITITVLLLITIFMYKNLKQQMKMAVVDIALIIGSIITTLVYIYSGNLNGVGALEGGTIMLVFAESFVVAARSRMKKDYKLLTSADRLR